MVDLSTFVSDSLTFSNNYFIYGNLLPSATRWYSCREHCAHDTNVSSKFSSRQKHRTLYFFYVMKTTVIQLTVPRDKSGCADWMLKQEPDVVASILEKSQSVFTTLKHLSDNTFSTLEKGLDKQLEHENKDLERQLQEKIATIREVKENMMKTEQENIHQMQKRLQELKTTVSEAYEKELEYERSRTAKLTQERDQFKSTTIQEERSKAEEEMRQRSSSYDLLVTTLQGEVASLKAQMLQSLHEREKEKEFFEKTFTSKDERIRELETEGKVILQQCNDKVSGVMSALTGSSARIGDLGETFVRRRISTLNLGTFEVENKNPNPGHADGTWKYEYVGSTPAILCMCEIKNEEELSQRDFDKFCKNDIPAARVLGKNWAMFLSLRCRISGKPSISIDTKHGMPVIWVSRDMEDTLSAEKMIDLAFHAVSEVWPIMYHTGQQTESSDTLVTLVSTHLEQHREELDKINRSAIEMEKMGQSITKKAVAMRSNYDTLIRGIRTLVNEDPRLSNIDSSSLYEFWENEGLALKKGLEQYHIRHARHAKVLSDLDLTDDVVKIIDTVPNAFKNALESVKTKIQKEATLKRNLKRKAQ